MELLGDSIILQQVNLTVQWWSICHVIKIYYKQQPRPLQKKQLVDMLLTIGDYFKVHEQT